MKRYEFLGGWNQGGTVEFSAFGISTLKDNKGGIIKGFRQISMEEVNYWLRDDFCKEI